MKIRPTVWKSDYVQAYTELKNFINTTYDRLEIIFIFWEIEKFRATFTKPYEEVRRSIDALPEDTDDERDFRERIFREYSLYLQQNNPNTYQKNIAEPLLAKERQWQKNTFRPAPIGPKNREAFRYLHRRFESVFKPLVGTFSEDSVLGPIMEKFLEVERDIDGTIISNNQAVYTQRIKELQKQRWLTKIELSYLKTVEYISLFNPYLVALANADLSIVWEFLHHHFDSISQETRETIEDDDYYPAILIGTGPQGITALGEITRNFPNLTGNMLIVDDARLPGWPFAVPNGRAWELNSANRRWKPGYTLPTKPPDEITEIATVRAYGSSVGRRYPGERENGADIRQWSINSTVDYMLTPDDISTARYPTNEDEAVVLQMQLAMMTEKIALSTRVVKVEPSLDPSKLGDKIVTLEIRYPQGKKEIKKIRTDAIIDSSWLWSPSYGFELSGTRAEKILANKNEKRFPRLSTTLEAFNAFSDKSTEKYSPGKEIVIYGSGNSCETLLEYIGISGK